MLPGPCRGIQSPDGIQTNKKSTTFMEEDLHINIKIKIKVKKVQSSVESKATHWLQMLRDIAYGKELLSSQEYDG